MMFMFSRYLPFCRAISSAGPSHVWHYHGNQYWSSLTHYVYRVVSPPCTCMMFVRTAGLLDITLVTQLRRILLPFFLNIRCTAWHFPTQYWVERSTPGTRPISIIRPLYGLICVLYMYETYTWRFPFRTVFESWKKLCFSNLSKEVYVPSSNGKSPLLSVTFRLDLFSYTYTRFL